MVWIFKAHWSDFKMSNWHHMGTSPLCVWFAACELNFSIWPCCSADTNFRKAVWQRWCISNVIKFKWWDIISANWAHLHELRSWRKRFVSLLCILGQLEELIITWHILQGANTKFILELLLYCPLLLVIELTCCKGGMHSTVMHTCSFHRFVFLWC